MASTRYGKPGKSWKTWKFRKGHGMSWNFFQSHGKVEKSWKNRENPGIFFWEIES